MNSISSIFSMLNGDENMSLRSHSNKVCTISFQIGKRVGLTEDELKELSIAALLHDIGKTKIPAEILNKKGQLTEEEMKIMKQHVRIGADTVRNMGYNDKIIASVLYHHERYNGDGYLEGISGENIPLFSRIITLADSFDAMTTNRCYKKALSIQEAVKEIEDNVGKQFDPKLCKKLIKIIYKEDTYTYPIHMLK